MKMVSIVCPVVAITGPGIFGAAGRDQTFVTLVLIGKFSKGICNDAEIDRAPLLSMVAKIDC